MAICSAYAFEYVCMMHRLIGGARKQPDGTWKDYIIMDSTDFPNGQLFPRIDAFGTSIYIYMYLHIAIHCLTIILLPIYVLISYKYDIVSNIVEHFV
jgi:hypothetical protein